MSVAKACLRGQKRIIPMRLEWEGGWGIENESLSRLALWKMLCREASHLSCSHLGHCLPAWSACHIWIVAVGLVHWDPVRDHREQGPIINHTDEQHAPQEAPFNDGPRSKLLWHGFIFWDNNVIVINSQRGYMIAHWWPWSWEGASGLASVIPYNTFKPISQNNKPKCLLNAMAWHFKGHHVQCFKPILN